MSFYDYDEKDSFEITEFINDILQVYINHNEGNTKIRELTWLKEHYLIIDDKNADLTIKEFIKKAYIKPYNFEDYLPWN